MANDNTDITAFIFLVTRVLLVHPDLGVHRASGKLICGAGLNAKAEVAV